MAPPVTECATIVLKPGVDLEGNTSEAQAWKETLTTLSQQAGYQKAYYGRQIESPNVLLLLIDWDSRQSHLDFIASPIYGPFVSRLQPLIESISLHHFVPSPFPPTLISSAPVIEVCTFFSVSPTFLSENVKKFFKAVDEGDVEGYVGNVSGEVVEEIEKEEGKGKGKAVKLLIGWISKEAHMKFRAGKVFEDSIGWLRKDQGGVEMFHVPFKTV